LFYLIFFFGFFLLQFDPIRFCLISIITLELEMIYSIPIIENGGLFSSKFLCVCVCVAYRLVLLETGLDLVLAVI